VKDAGTYVADNVWFVDDGSASFGVAFHKT
jgi:hypothetical protein